MNITTVAEKMGAAGHFTCKALKALPLSVFLGMSPRFPHVPRNGFRRSPLCLRKETQLHATDRFIETEKPEALKPV